MRRLVRLHAILIVFLIPLALCDAANGCVCGGYPTTCEAFVGAESVFVGTVTTVEQINPRKDEEGNAVSDGQLARVHVEQAFKNMKQTEVVFRSANSDCDAVYKEGQRWLFYAYYDRKGKALTVHACDRSTLIEYAAPADARQLQAGFHTAVLDDVPEDTDVFLVLSRRPSVPEWIMTRQYVYRVEPDGTINYVMTAEAFKKMKP